MNNTNYKLKYLKYKLKYLQRKQISNLIGGNNLKELLNQFVNDYMVDNLVTLRNKKKKEDIPTKEDNEADDKLTKQYDSIINFILPGISVKTHQSVIGLLTKMIKKFNINTDIYNNTYKLYTKISLNNIILLYKNLYNNTEDGYNNFINNLISKNYIPDINFNNVICNIDNNIICKSILRINTSLDNFIHTEQEQLLAKVFNNIYKTNTILCNKESSFSKPLILFEQIINDNIINLNIEYSKKFNLEYITSIISNQDDNLHTIYACSIPQDNSILICENSNIDTTDINNLKEITNYYIKSIIFDIYELKGIIWNVGEGHFITHIKTNDQWNLFNDGYINEQLDPRYTKTPRLDEDINLGSMKPVILFYYKNNKDYIDREPHGISNSSNSCWFASVMQNLIRMKPFIENINSDDYNTNDSNITNKS